MRPAPIMLAAAGTATALGTIAAYRAIVRPWYETWGVDPADEGRLLPGDELIASPTAGDTRGIEIAAPAAAIWPWLAQMGLGRGGWYSYDALDMKGRSAEAIVPEWQSIAVGETVSVWPGGGFEVAQVEQDHALVLYLDDRIVAAQQQVGRDIAITGVNATSERTPGLATSEAILRTQPRQFRASWAFVLDPIDGARTRLVERLRVEYPAIGPWNRITGPLFGTAVFLMTRRHMLGIRRRAERLVHAGPEAAARPEGSASITNHPDAVPA